MNNVIRLKDMVRSSRTEGEEFRKNISSILKKQDVVLIDCVKVGVMTGGFADEAFGKLFLELGPMKFTQKIIFAGMDPLMENLLDRAINQRIKLSI